MNKIAWLSLVLLLVGCGDPTEELQQFVVETKANNSGRVAPLHNTPDFEHYAYQSQNLRSPFSPPVRETIQEIYVSNKDCLKPDINRVKSSAESYALESLKMRGTLSRGKQIVGLIESDDNRVFQVNKGDYVGLYHGRVDQVSSSQINIVELIPDGAGCWTERVSSMELATE